MNASFRPLLAEALGTALFVFVGTASIVANAMTAGGVGNLGIALAHGVGMAVIISALMSISGGHINPAVSFGLFVAGKIEEVVGEDAEYQAARRRAVQWLEQGWHLGGRP